MRIFKLMAIIGITFFGMLGVVLAKQTMTVTTGYGYYTWNGKIISKYVFSPGQYNLADNVTYTETDNTFNSVIVNDVALNSYDCLVAPSQPGC